MDGNKTTEGNMFKIEKGIPIPENKKNSKFPWSSMEVGDSFFAQSKKSSTMSVYCTRFGKDLGFRFISRAVYEGDKFIGVRVWRVR